MLSLSGGVWCSFGRRRHGLQRDHVTGAGASRVLGVLAADRVGTEDLAGPPKPAARAAFFGIWGEVGRDAEESERQRRRYYGWKNPGCIGRCLPWKGSAMHQAFFSRGRIRDASPDLFPISRSSPVSGARQARHAQATLHRAPPLSSPRLDGTPSKQPATRAQRQHAKPRHRVSCGRPPARPPATGISNLVKFPRSCSATGQEKRSSSGRRPGRRATSMRPTESEGSRRQAATRMRQGKSGANAPDRNRGRPPPGPPARRAA